MMTPSEIAELLGTIQAFDRRTVGEADVMAWHAVLREYELDHAKAAVIEHFSNSKEWIAPVDIKAIIGRKRKRVLEGIPPVVPPWQLADLPEDENRWRGNYIHAIADGLPETQARLRANYLAGITEEAEPLALEESPISLRAELDRAERARRDGERLKQIQAEVDRREKAEAKERRAAEVAAAELAAQPPRTPHDPEQTNEDLGETA